MAYIVDTGQVPVFKFKLKPDGREYSVTAAMGLPMEQLMDYSDALAQGNDAAMRWIYSFFRASCPEIAKVPLAKFINIAAAWRNGEDGEEILGESSASSG